MNNANNASQSITVGELREMLESAPQEAVVRFAMLGTTLELRESWQEGSYYFLDLRVSD